MKEDLDNTDVLYLYGEYVSENETKMLSFLNSLPKERMKEIAKTFVDGYHDGFIINNIDRSKKNNRKYPVSSRVRTNHQGGCTAVSRDRADSDSVPGHYGCDYKRDVKSRVHFHKSKPPV